MSASAKTRLDQLMVQRGLTRSRSHARDLIKRGKVRHGDRIAAKPGEMVDVGCAIHIDEDTGAVGRGTHKLTAALAAFAVQVADRVAVDVGASTGGFTQVLLQQGASRVYAIDVGHDQLAPELREDRRVINMEGLNIRDGAALPEKASIAVADLSFISLRLILGAIADLVTEDGDMILLVKPQFEAGPGGVNHRGVVASATRQRDILDAFLAWCGQQGWWCHGTVDSPIAGKTGNREFLVHLKRDKP
ncbi:TlyA family RNA methyltransferase [Sulfidibacter corallicola]|uniref:TlyA family RNA methyltransferase n=1 Tax=Sulfidibacter corallicola TaxID=2818388 RepID=A0A8A4TE96_SULCO|nr:TlyA family RNA methyltransferase [Sulfidibacter corallicola]QTD47890.1 TlyA family RNA methyltransferase [Sulfidibacter corallicola]